MKRRIKINDLPECYRNQVADKAAAMEQTTRNGALAAGKAAQYCTPVNIDVHIFAVRETDLDGNCIKYMLDAIVESGLLKDDNPKCVKEIRFTQEKSAFDETVITITPAASC